MISAKIFITEKDSAEMKNFKAVFSKVFESYVTIGIHEDAGKYTKGANPPSVIDVALWNEFGTDKIPERSYFRATLEANASKIEVFRDEMCKRVLLNGWTQERALEAIGLYVQTLIQAKIRSNVPPAYGTGKGNSPATIAAAQEAKIKRVGHSRTLEESDLLLRSVTFKVTVK